MPMETFAGSSTSRHTRIRIATTRHKEFIDITDEVRAAAASLHTGIVNVQSLHTTTGIVLNEHEPLLLDDFLTLLERAAPASAGYTHDDLSIRTVNLTPDERVNGHAHCRALLVGPSVCLNVVGGRLELGRWQRIFLAEFDGPRVRDVSVLALGEIGR
jgi:secondary thiamine-phosphate synthase enzyme